LRRSTFVLLLLAACNTAAPAPPPPQFTAVPSGVLESMCMRLHDEGIASTVDLVRTSRPLVTRQSLQALAELAFKPNVDSALVEAAVATNATALPIGKNESCAWHPVGAASPRSADTMTLELSAPFAAPFRRGGTGVLARLSLGGESATWYWIPLVNQNGAWVAGHATPLALHQ
jgi:hypothetical protein